MGSPRILFDFADGALSPFDASVVTRESACSPSNEPLNSNRFEKLADEDGQFTSNSGACSVSDLGDERPEQLPLSPPPNGRDERAASSPTFGTDMEECESDSSDSDSESAVVPQLVEDDEFEAYCEEANKKTSRRRVERERARDAVAAIERKLLGISECREAANFECSCETSCALRSKVTGASIQAIRRVTLSQPLHDGSRLISLARAIQSSMTDSPSHLHSDNPRKKRDGSKVWKTRAHLVINGMDVCPLFLCMAKGISNSLLDKARKMALASNMVIPKRKRSSDASGTSHTRIRGETSYSVVVAVQWLLWHVIDSGAEFIPTAAFDGLSTAEAQSNQATTGQAEEALENTCKIRLHERNITELYEKYVASSRGLSSFSSSSSSSSSSQSPSSPSATSGFRFEPLSYSKFCEVFNKNKDLVHVRLKRNTDNFAKCSICFETAAILATTGVHTEAARAAAPQQRKYHIHAEAENRRAYARRTFEPNVDRTRMLISGALSIVVDKPTKEATRQPALAQYPKYLGTGRMPNSIIGAIAHGYGSLVGYTPGANTEGINLTCTFIYLIIGEIQTDFNTPRKLNLQADNHADNKTPAMFCFVAWLIAKDVIDEATINFLSPGHGHMDLDRLFSKWIRSILDVRNKSVTRSRLMDSIKRSRSRTTAVTSEVKVNGILDWAAFFAPAIADVGLHRYAMSSTSGEGIYQYILKKNTDGVVELFYKHRSMDDEVYPKLHQVGQNVVVGGKSCSVVDCKFNTVTQHWDFTAESPDAMYITYSAPPVGIRILDGQSGVPLGMPAYEGLNPKYVKQYEAAKGPINTCFTRMSAMKDTPGAIAEWKTFFEDEDRLIARCKADGGPYYRGETPPPFRPGVAQMEPTALPPPAQTVFNVDPVVFKPVGGSSGYSDAQRVAYAKAAAKHAQNKLIDGTLVALRLQHGARCPESHSVPFCLGLVPSGHRSIDVPQFSDFFLRLRVVQGRFLGIGRLERTSLLLFQKCLALV